ncbi:MAG: DUF3450 domain-containing protein [Clostridia bacterium]|nr:DUF3450 domain-containing protein [Clostridia bacterium]
MNANNYLIFKDNSSDLWEFHLTADNNLVYSVTSADGKNKEEGSIDTDVLEFAADIDKKGVVHFAYIQNEHLKYGELNDGRWSSEAIHCFEGVNYTARELRLCLAGKNASIFYIFKKDISKNIGSLCHCLWDGKQAKIKILDEINLLPGGRTSFRADILDNHEILLIFVSNDGKEVLFKSIMYVNSVFSNIGLLFALKGNSIDFHVVRHGKEYHILNLSVSNEKHMLEDIVIERPGKIKSITKIYQCENKISDSLLLIEAGILWAMWKVGDKLFHCFYEDEWSRAAEFSDDSDRVFRVYHYIEQGKDGNYRFKRVMGIDLPDIDLLSPKKHGGNEHNTNGPCKRTGQAEDTKHPIYCSIDPEKQISLPHTQPEQMRLGPEKTLGEIIKESDVKWREELGKTQWFASGQSKRPGGMVHTQAHTPPKPMHTTLPSPSLPPHIPSEDGWSKEMYKNSAAIVRQKAELEKKYTELMNDKSSLEEERNKLKDRLDQENSHRKSLEEQIDRMEIMIDELKNELEAEKNKGIWDIIFRR